MKYSMINILKLKKNEIQKDEIIMTYGLPIKYKDGLPKDELYSNKFFFIVHKNDLE